MRQITDHIINPANDKLTITVADAPGADHAHHRYEVHGFALHTNTSATASDLTGLILFQNGPIDKVGVNGITHEALLAILIDRLRCIQTGPYACPENSVALDKVEDALWWLQRRTAERMRRGVEGTDKV